MSYYSTIAKKIYGKNFPVPIFKNPSKSEVAELINTYCNILNELILEFNFSIELTSRFVVDYDDDIYFTSGEVLHTELRNNVGIFDTSRVMGYSYYFESKLTVTVSPFFMKSRICMHRDGLTLDEDEYQAWIKKRLFHDELISVKIPMSIRNDIIKPRPFFSQKVKNKDTY